MEAQKPNATKPAAAPKAKAKTQKSNAPGIKNASIVILICFLITATLYLFWFGAPSHFFAEGEIPADVPASMFFYDGEAHPHDIRGTIFMGGVIVPVLQCLFLTVIVLCVERWFALNSAKGKGDITKFVANIKAALAKNDFATAKQLCKKQGGSVAAVVAQAINSYEEMDKNTVLSKEQKIANIKAALAKNDFAGAKQLCKKQGGSVAAVVAQAINSYEEMDKNTELTKEQKIANIQKSLEEATALEMPALQQNLPIVATMTTLGTLVGLLGTVVGMIKSFQALSASGAPDSTALSAGISEALINTAFGIATGAFAVIGYNFYTNKIDHLTYAIDEIGFSIVQTYAASH